MKVSSKESRIRKARRAADAKLAAAPPLRPYQTPTILTLHGLSPRQEPFDGDRNAPLSIWEAD